MTMAQAMARLHRALFIEGELSAAAIVAEGLLEAIKVENGRSYLDFTSGAGLALADRIKRMYPHTAHIVTGVMTGR